MANKNRIPPMPIDLNSENVVNAVPKAGTMLYFNISDKPKKEGYCRVELVIKNGEKKIITSFEDMELNREDSNAAEKEAIKFEGEREPNPQFIIECTYRIIANYLARDSTVSIMRDTQTRTLDINIITAGARYVSLRSIPWINVLDFFDEKKDE